MFLVESLSCSWSLAKMNTQRYVLILRYKNYVKQSYNGNHHIFTEAVHENIGITDKKIGRFAFIFADLRVHTGLLCF